MFLTKNPNLKVKIFFFVFGRGWGNWGKRIGSAGDRAQQQAEEGPTEKK